MTVVAKTRKLTQTNEKSRKKEQFLLTAMYTVPWKCARLVFDDNSVISWATVTLIVPKETGINTR